MLQRFGTESVTMKGDGRMKGSGEKVEEEGYTASGQNRIRIPILTAYRGPRASNKTPWRNSCRAVVTGTWNTGPM